jgi:hypothetical protein
MIKRMPLELPLAVARSMPAARPSLSGTIGGIMGHGPLVGGLETI